MKLLTIIALAFSLMLTGCAATQQDITALDNDKLCSYTGAIQHVGSQDEFLWGYEEIQSRIKNGTLDKERCDAMIEYGSNIKQSIEASKPKTVIIY